MVGGFEVRVYEVVSALEPGQVVTYGEVAAEAGAPGAARAVGNLLRSSTGLPWWRVIPASGRPAPGIAEEQRTRLEAEGVEFTASGRVLPTARQEHP
jgi:methylated-DNA-protein-cysteine methyltransferase-like protein